MKSEWQVIETTEAVHVLPIGDLISHATSQFCVCGPELNEDRLVNSKVILTHNSFDRREDVEEEWDDEDWDDEDWEWEEDDDDW